MEKLPQPQLEKPKIETQTLEDFCESTYWKVFGEDYERDMNELRVVVKGSPCICHNCVQRNKTRYNELYTRWFSEEGNIPT